MRVRRDRFVQRRKASGYTQEDLAQRLGVERSTVVRWERGTTEPQPWTRPGLAEALQLNHDQLDQMLHVAGHSDSPVRNEPPSGAEPRLPASRDGSGLAPAETLRRLLDVYDLPEDGPVRTLDELSRDLSFVVSDRLNSNYRRVVARLRTLLPDLTRFYFSCHDAQRPTAAKLLVQAYRGADAVADKFGWRDLSARTIEVMRWAATASEDALTRSVVSYVRAETFFASGQFPAGHSMLERAANSIAPGTSREVMAAYGSLHMRAAITAARGGLTRQARDHLAEARDSAREVTEGIYEGTAFGPGSVRIHEVTLELDLGAPDRALAAAAGWTPSDVVPAERRSHFYIDIARAQLLIGRYEETLDAIHTARTIAPEHIRVHPQVRQMLDGLDHRGGACSRAVRQFAAHSGRDGLGRQ